MEKLRTKKTLNLNLQQSIPYRLIEEKKGFNDFEYDVRKSPISMMTKKDEKLKGPIVKDKGQIKTQFRNTGMIK